MEYRRIDRPVRNRLEMTAYSQSNPKWAKNMLLFEVNELDLEAQLFDLLCHSFKQTISYFITFPLMRGEGWDGGGHRGPPPHLYPVK
jgi:hypothetical protein